MRSRQAHARQSLRPFSSAARGAAPQPPRAGLFSSALKLFDQRPGVDSDRTGNGAHAVARAGLDPVVLVLLAGAGQASASPGVLAGHFTPAAAIRCRGVMVTLRLGQTGSQNPHSMHCEEPVTLSICGQRFQILQVEFWRCASGSRSVPECLFGSASCFDAATSWRWPSRPIPTATNGAMFRTGSVLGLQQSRRASRTTRSTSSVMKAAYRDSPSGATEIRDEREMKISVGCVARDTGDEPVLG